MNLQVEKADASALGMFLILAAVVHKDDLEALNLLRDLAQAAISLKSGQD